MARSCRRHGPGVHSPRGGREGLPTDFRGKKRRLSSTARFLAGCSTYNRHAPTLPEQGAADVHVLGVSVLPLWSTGVAAQNWTLPLLADFTPRGDVASTTASSRREGSRRRTAFIIGKTDARIRY